MSKKKKAVAEKQPVINESYELVATDRLTPHPRNVNRGDLVAIGGSIAENGFYGAVVAQKSTGHILAGNHRYDAAKAAGIAEVPVTWVDVDDDRALRILLADNRTTRLGHDDQEALAALLQEILADTETLAGTGFDETALDELLAEVGVTECEAEALTDEDAVPEPLSFPITEPGDLWVLGKHRLLCGDSTSIDAVERLMDGERADICFTSPPYNAGQLSVSGNESTKKKYNLFDDDQTEDGYREFVVSNIDGILTVCDEVFYNIGLVENNKRVIIDVLAHYRSQFKDIIYWNKDTVAPHIQPGVVNNKVEFIICIGDGRRKFKHAQFGQGTYWNVISGPNASGNEFAKIHKATFPAYLPENIVVNFSRPRAVVLDTFGGTGTTLIACEKVARKACLMELDPKYCDVIVKRWQDFTGKEAVLESDGRTFNEISAQRNPEAAAA